MTAKAQRENGVKRDLDNGKGTMCFARMPDEVDIADFIDGQLSFLRRRAIPEERARIDWWRRRVQLLAKQQPEALPVEMEPAPARSQPQAVAG